MKPDIKKAWVDALRSGKYRQTSGFLKQNEATGEAKYCCLGVLCDIYERETGDMLRTELGPTFADSGWAQGVLPTRVVTWSGTVSDNPPVVADVHARGQESATTLALLNDEYGFTFEMIADLIDDQL